MSSVSSLFGQNSSCPVRVFPATGIAQGEVIFEFQNTAPIPPPHNGVQISGFANGTYDRVSIIASNLWVYDISPNIYDPANNMWSSTTNEYHPGLNGTVVFNDSTTCHYVDGMIQNLENECPNSFHTRENGNMLFPYQPFTSLHAGSFLFDFGVNHPMNGFRTPSSAFQSPAVLETHSVFSGINDSIPLPPTFNVTWNGRVCTMTEHTPSNYSLAGQSYAGAITYDCPSLLTSVTYTNPTNHQLNLFFEPNANMPPVGLDQIEVSGFSSGIYSNPDRQNNPWNYNNLSSINSNLTGTVSFLDGSQIAHTTCSYNNGVLTGTPCPEKIECWNNQLLLWFPKRANSPYVGKYNLFFGPNSPDNGDYNGTNPFNSPAQAPSPDYDFILVDYDKCFNQSGPEFIMISSSEISNCSFTNDCISIVNDCGDIIVDEIEKLVTNCKQWVGSCNPDYPIYRTGKVALGTSNYDDEHQLTVKGGILTERFKVNSGGNWCDYVFQKDYNLLPLLKVEKHINENGYLHNMQSQEEIIGDKGYDLNTMVLKQQEKIEEMFLHLIELDEKTQTLENTFINSSNK